MKPLGRRVLVDQTPNDGTYHGVIHIPDRYRMKAQEGVVTAIGPDVTTLHVGDHVLFGKFASIDVKQHGLLLWEQDIMAVFE